MPNRRQHLRASKKLLGTSNPVVHDILDKTLPYVVEHRRTHTPHYINLIGELLGKEAETEAWLHFFMDYEIVKI